MKKILALLLIALCHPLLDLVYQRIAHVDGLTGIVRAADVAHPAGHAEGQQRPAAAALKMHANTVEHALG